MKVTLIDSYGRLCAREIPDDIIEASHRVHRWMNANGCKQISGLTTMSTSTIGLLNELRANGWRVAAHNDYKLGGVWHTFWLLTHEQSNLYVKSEAISDLLALEECAYKINQIYKPSP